MRKRTQGRESALQILYQHELNPTDLEILFRNFWSQFPEISGEVKAFAESLVRGTLRYEREIDEVISKYTENWDLRRMAVIDRSILRFACYELLYCGDIPPKVTINEAVNIAKKFSQHDSGKFVNGILDKINHTESARGSAGNAG